MIACGFDGLCTKNYGALGETYFYGGRKPQANSNKWATVLANNNEKKYAVNEKIPDAIISLLDEYLKQDQSFSPEEKLQNIISESIKNNTEKDWRYYFVKYSAMTDDTWGEDYGDCCYYAYLTDYEFERLTSVSFNPLLGYHINVFNIAVYEKLGDDKINYGATWAIYAYQSCLWLKNNIRMFCGEEGWKIDTTEAIGDILSDEIKKEFSITGDLILKENEQKDRVEIAVSFIERLFQQNDKA
jgi:hypothetical protein